MGKDARRIRKFTSAELSSVDYSFPYCGPLLEGQAVISCEASTVFSSGRGVGLSRRWSARGSEGRPEGRSEREAVLLGLSKAHIWPPSENKGENGQKRSWADRAWELRQEGKAGFEALREWSRRQAGKKIHPALLQPDSVVRLREVCPAAADRIADSRESASRSYEWESYQGGSYNLLVARREFHGVCLLRRERQGGGCRDIVRKMSRASSRRLQIKLGKLDHERAVPVLVTLTWPGSWLTKDWSREGRQWKAYLHAFRKRVERKYGKVFGSWLLEPQGRGAPHFHLLLWVDFIDKDWLARAWFEVVGSGEESHLWAGTRVEKVRSWRGIASYMSRYFKQGGKHEVPDDWKRPGRFWGFWNDSAAPRVQLNHPISRGEFHILRRWTARYLHSCLSEKKGREWWRATFRQSVEHSSYAKLWAFLPGEMIERWVMYLDWCKCPEKAGRVPF